MKVSRESWHCRLLTKYAIYPTNLCSYFWLLTITMLFIHPINSVLSEKMKRNLSIGILLIIYIIGLPHLYNYFTMESYHIPLWAVGPTIISMLGTTLLIIVLLSVLPFLALDTTYFRLFKEYLKAKKDKLCPLIEYVGGGKDEKG